MKFLVGFSIILALTMVFVCCQDRRDQLDLVSQPAPTAIESLPAEVVTAGICFLHGGKAICTPIPVGQIYHESRAITGGGCMVYVTLPAGNTILYYGSPRTDWKEKLPDFPWSAPIVAGNQIQPVCCGLYRHGFDVISEQHDYSLKIRFLLGDVRPDGAVNAADRLDVQDAVGQVVTETNARCDVNTDGSINGQDRIIVRDMVGK